MPTRRAVIFDLDGTLADTLGTIAEVVNFALTQLELPTHELDAFRTMVGDGIVKLCERALPEGRQDLWEPLIAAVRTRYATHATDQAALYPGIREVLVELRKRGARLGVLSNKPHPLTVQTVEDLQIAERFDCVLGHKEEFSPKPDPAGARWMVEQLGVARESILYVGDTCTDMETARAAGLTPVGVAWGFRPREELVESGAEHVIESAAEILALYDS